MADPHPSGALFCPQCMNSVGDELGFCPRCSLKRPSRGWPADRFVGRLVDDKYRLVRRLGAGGFALVFLARQVQGDVDLGEVVLKYLQQSMADNESVRRRFTNEARAARKVGSPHVVKVFDLGFDETGLPYMVMEYIQGESLDAVMKPGPMDGARVVHIGLQVAGALEECHQAEIIHRDLKPDNLMLLSGRDGDFVKVLDFGIARVPSKDGPVTKTIMGTPRYMPPEQILQQGIDAGADIFALGVILFECLTGRSPITCKNSMEYLHKNLTESPTPLREVCPQMPAALEALLLRMMAKDRPDRPASMADVELRLRSIGEQQGWISGKGRTRSRVSTEEVDPSAETIDPSAETIPPPSTESSGLWVDDLDLPEEERGTRSAERGTGSAEPGALDDTRAALEHSETLPMIGELQPSRKPVMLVGLAALAALAAGLWLWAPWQHPGPAPSPPGEGEIDNQARPDKVNVAQPGETATRPDTGASPDAGSKPADSRPAPEAAAGKRAHPGKKRLPRKNPGKKRPRKKDEWGKEEGGL